ncbi:MAG: hypothetical protein E7655_00575 [Ruminococcaceae bacterium]|nr:hypothetical protein [Oscillospiraceae bacterium]
MKQIRQSEKALVPQKSRQRTVGRFIGETAEAKGDRIPALLAEFLNHNPIFALLESAQSPAGIGNRAQRNQRPVDENFAGTVG